ncbi:MAG: hypothetical protein H0X28_15230, partial [Solirubrobacterales bacterium]|nr:hypothetical protein [Solirubrobacterales bacterium]
MPDDREEPPQYTRYRARPRLLGEREPDPARPERPERPGLRRRGGLRRRV